MTNVGGPAILATDTLIEGGGELAQLPADLKQQLDQVLPAYWSHGNPIDVGGDADPERFAAAVKIANANPDSNGEAKSFREITGLLVVLTPQAMTAPLKTVKRLLPILRGSTKPVLASWIGGDAVTNAAQKLNLAGIPTFAFPETAARAFNHSWRYQDQLRTIYETPAASGDFDSVAGRRAAVGSNIDDALGAGRTLLTEEESKRVLRDSGIPTTPTFVALTVEDAVNRARGLGFPVVLKLHSISITHKADVGGVCLDLRTADEVRALSRASSSRSSRRDWVTSSAECPCNPISSVTESSCSWGRSPTPNLGRASYLAAVAHSRRPFVTRPLGFRR